MEENKSHGEIQSKTVLINDNEGVNDMLSALNVGREKMEQAKKKKKRNEMIFFFLKIFLAFVGIFAVGGIVYMLMT
jgi:hypothetical protein